ncbi:MAG: LysR family transcriptional regulator [Lachnospiraceae bacterium]|nr:LysR family transcriptional regulator [Lachnospiraceae bacterium]
MTITQIRYFVEVSNQMSYTKAAQSLYVVQQVVSKQVKRLEEEVGCQLFERQSGSLCLTEAGQILHDFWGRMLQEQEEALWRARCATQGIGRTVRVGALAISTIQDRLAETISVLSEQQPNQHFTVSSDSYRGLYQKLVSGQLDCIISLEDENTRLSDDFEEQPFLELWPSIVIARSHPLYREGVTAKELANTTFYILSSNFSWHAEHNTLKYCSMCGFMPRHIEYFDDVGSMEMALYAGTGISIIYAEFFRNPAGRLMVVPLEDNPRKISTQFSVTYRKNQKDRLAPFLAELLKNRN